MHKRIKMKTYEELESYMDKELELKSRYLCLQQLYTFSVGKLGVYRRKTDGKEIPGLLKLLDEDEKATSEAVEYYMVEQYSSFCNYLRGCMEAADEEYAKLQSENGYSDEKTTQNSLSDSL